VTSTFQAPDAVATPRGAATQGSGSGARGWLDTADLAMLGVVIVWAANNVVVKDALDELSPLAYVGGRFVIVLVLLFGWFGARRSLRVPDRADLPLLLLAGLAGYAAYNTLFTFGLEHTSAFSVALLISLGPIFTILLATALGTERIRSGQWLGIACAAIGVAVFVGNTLRNGAPAAGDLLSLLAAFSFSVYSLATQPLVRRYGAPTATAWSALVGLVAILPWAGPAMVRQPWLQLSLAGWGALLFASVLSMLAAYSVWAWAISQRGVGRTVPFLYLVPILTGIFAALLLDERFGAFKMAGGALVLVGVGLVRLAGRGAIPAQTLPVDRSDHAHQR